MIFISIAEFRPDVWGLTEGYRKMAGVGCNVAFLVTLLVVPLASSSFVPDLATVPMDTQLPCPKSCRCLDEERTASCLLPYSEFSLESLTPWHIKSLELYQNDWPNDRTVFPSLKGALYEDRKMAVTNTENEILELPDLVHLDVSDVAILQLRDFTFINMPNLQILKLTDDGITAVEPYTFAGLSNLRHLSLRNNSLSSLPNHVFDDLVQLIKLDVSGNGLKMIELNTFDRLSNLRELNLNRNALSYVGQFTNKLTSLEILDLSYNSISYILNETVNSLSSIETVLLTGNKFECSCAIHMLIHSAQQNTTFKNPEEVTCAGPSDLIGQSFRDVILEDLPCEGARIDTVTDDFSANHHGYVTLNCTTTGSSPLGMYWVTPWGDNFTHSSMHILLPEHITHVKYDSRYAGVNLPMESRVYVSENGSLLIEKFRGYLAGNFTCMAVNLIGIDEASVGVDIYSTLPSVYRISLYVSAVCAVAALAIGALTGGIRWCVGKCFHEDDCNCCCCSKDDEFVDPKDMYRVESEEIEVKNGALNRRWHDEDKDYYEDSPPKTPFNSPAYQTPQESPKKCHTPNNEQMETEGWISSRILEQLDEVRSRLRYGAERKMIKMKSLGKTLQESSSNKIKNIKETGSLKIQSIKETGSLAASAVMKSVESGMEQVKYGYQSIKEFCGTSDMGPGTISMVSVSTDVDTKEQVRIVKSHTFV